MSRLLCPATRTTASLGNGPRAAGGQHAGLDDGLVRSGHGDAHAGGPVDPDRRDHLLARRSGGRSRVVTSARHDAVQPGVVQDRRDLSTGGDHVQDRDVLLPCDRVEQHHGATVRRHDHAPAVGRGHRPPGSEHLEVDRHGVRAGVGQHDPLTPAGLGPTGQEPGLGRRGAAGRRDQAPAVTGTGQRPLERHRARGQGARAVRTADFAELT